MHFFCRVLGYSKPWLYTWLKRDGLAGQRPYQPRGTPYPALAAQRPNQVHQLDLVGPRYLKGEERFYGVQLMDAYSNAVALAAMPSKQAVEVVEAVAAGWQKLGLPRSLHMDHELSFRGSNRHPRSFGLLHRLCLYLGVEVVFIPEAGRWRNGSGPAGKFMQLIGAGMLTFFHQGHRVKRYPYIIPKSFEAS